MMVVIVVADDDVVVAIRMPGWRGYGDCVVISGIVVIIGSTSGRPIRIS